MISDLLSPTGEPWWADNTPAAWVVVDLVKPELYHHVHMPGTFEIAYYMRHYGLARRYMCIGEWVQFPVNGP